MIKTIAILLFPVMLLGGADDYISPKEYFGESYTEAIEFLQKNERSFDEISVWYDIDKSIAMAIVFPELIRYNRFRDFAETSVLEFTYVDGGMFAADFSIGYFQMKPSFVEYLEEIVNNSPTLQNSFKHITSYGQLTDTKQIRKERLRRLKSNKWQLEYLACFMVYGEIRFSEILSKNPGEKLLILSSLYNYGLNASYDELQNTANTKTFPYGRYSPTRFSYFDVAEYYYKEQKNKNTDA